MYRVNRAPVLKGLLLGTAICLAAPASASNYKIRYNFEGFAHGDGSQPSGELVADSSGRLYGTTFMGGTHNGGTVFRLGSGHREEVLFNFPSDNAGPMGGVLPGSAGVLYGTTKLGGSAVGGTVWRLNANGTLTILHAFNPAGGVDGFYPEAGLTFGKDGMLYGTTAGQPPQDGSVRGPNVIYGTVFRVSPDGDPSKYAVLHVFGLVNDGQFPMHGRLLADKRGVLSGTTELGGKYADGIVYQLHPPKPGRTSWRETVLHHFAAPGTFDAAAPISGLTRDSSGVFYGCAGGGTHGNGAVYSVTRTGVETVLHNFGDQANDPAAAPSCAVTHEVSGALYGMSSGGGANANKGTVFKLEPPVSGSGPWTETVLHSFGPGDGQNPDTAPLKRGSVLYGTTELGGANASGTVFKLRP